MILYSPVTNTMLILDYDDGLILIGNGTTVNIHNNDMLNGLAYLFDKLHYVEIGVL
jgi:hypothetical protein